MKTIWIDIESTGIDHNTNTIIELAALYENDTDKSIFHEYILPASRPDDFATIEELTGITWEYLELNGITEAEAYKQFTDWIGKRIDKYDKKDKAIFAAYNARFDNDYMRDLFIHNNDNYFGSWFYSAPLDIMGTAILMVRLGYIPVPVNFKNVTICESFGIEHKVHSAIDDIKASRLAQLEMEKLLNK
jgi:DNA polymerase III subunit epsilon